MALEIRVSRNLTSSGEGVFKNNGDRGNEMNCATVVFISKNHLFLRILQNSISIFLLGLRGFTRSDKEVFKPSLSSF